MNSTRSVLYTMPLIGIKFRVVSLNDPDELFSDFDLDYDISCVESATFIHKINHNGKFLSCVTCVFNSDHEPNIKRIAEEGYMAMEAAMGDIGESSDAYAIKSRLIGWIINKIDQHFLPPA